MDCFALGRDRLEDREPRTPWLTTCYQQVAALCTSRSTSALLAASPLPRPASVRCSAPTKACRHRDEADLEDAQSTGVRRPSAGRPPAPAACATSRTSRGASRTASRTASPRTPATTPSWPRPTRTKCVPHPLDL